MNIIVIGFWCISIACILIMKKLDAGNGWYKWWVLLWCVLVTVIAAIAQTAG